MKTIITTIASVFFTGALAQADYQCYTIPAGVTLTTVNHQFTRISTDTASIIQNGQQKLFYDGKLQTDGGPMLGKEAIQIYPFEKGNTLTIVSKPKFCGRGFCDPMNNKLIQAIFKIDNSETSFFCDKVNN